MKYYLSNSYQFLQATADCSDCFKCPQKLYIDITQDCNLWCSMCRDKISMHDKAMSFDLFKRIIDETSAYVRSYSLFIWGEPLLVKSFCEMVRYTNKNKRPDCNIEISTNGMLLTQQMTDFLVSENVDLIVSVDGADKSTFESIRRGANFELVIKNVEHAAKAYHDYPIQKSPSFYISIQKLNQNKILEIVKLGLSLGIMRIGCGLVVAPLQAAAVQGEKLCKQLEKVYQFIDANDMFIEVCPTKIGEYVLVGNKYRNASNYIVNTICNAAMVSAVIDYSGDVYLCCNAGARVGSMLNSSLIGIWKSDKYNTLRSDINNPAKMPDKCKNCTWFNRN